MKVILKQAVEPLGRPGDVVEVKDGYARNFLIPKDLAAPATSFNIRNIEHQRRDIARKVAREEAAAMSMADRLRTVTVTVRRQAGEQEKLFGSVTTRDIGDALRQEGIQLDHRMILLEAPIRELGVHDIVVKLPHGVKGTFKLLVDRA
jgi:large subunit ribosomal protein L9